MGQCYFVFALGEPKMLRIDFMLSRTERIDEFHLKVTRTEKELYEEFLKTEEAALVLEIQQYFTQAKGHAGEIRFDNTSLWSKIENRVGVWFAEVFADRNQNENLIRRSKEAILHRMKICWPRRSGNRLAGSKKAQPLGQLRSLSCIRSLNSRIQLQQLTYTRQIEL